MRTLALLSSLLVSAGTVSSQEASAEKVTVYRGAKLYPGSGPAIPRATIVIRGGKIEAVGKDAAVPEGAEVVDASRSVILPGLIDAASPLFVDSGSRSAGSAEQNVLDALDLYQEDWKEAVRCGVTTVYVGPVSSGAINGQGAVLRLDGRATVLRRSAALKLTLGAATGDVTSASLRYAGYRHLRQALEGARRYREGWEKYRKDLAEYRKKKKEAEKAKDKKKTPAPKEPRKPRKDPRSETLVRALDASKPLPVRIEVHTADAIELALRLISEFKLRASLEYVTEGDALAAAIAKAKVPVVAGPVFRYGPAHVDYLNHSVACPAAMARAGVRVAIGSFGDPRAGHRGAGASRFLLDAAALASSKGLPIEKAIAAITIEAARTLGIDKELGSVEKGKRADLVVLSGEPFDPETRVERTLMDGRIRYERAKGEDK